jgi:N6-adenosine-specific RNA methylase IME4
VAADYKVTPERIRQVDKLYEGRLWEPPAAGDVPLPDGKYRCIVVDPPWPMERIQRDERALQPTKLDYEVMSLEDIAGLPILEQAEPSWCHLYLWTTQSFLWKAKEILDGWGFHHHCVLTWCKPGGFTPFSFMFNTEFVLFGYVGKLELQKLGLKTSFHAPVGVHSRKPDVFYDLVRQASPGPRLDMFAREHREGFVAWGNEVLAATPAADIGPVSAPAA